jgi:hypothetical protein
MILGFGLGLGLGLPILAAIVFFGYWTLVRGKKRKQFVPRPKYIPQDPPLPSEERSSIVVGDMKDPNMF